MAMQNKRSMIDTRWQELQPSWSPKEHDAEREMLSDVLSDDEGIESVVGCVWGRKTFSAQAPTVWTG